MSAPQLELVKDTENPERRGLKKGLYLVPSLFTAANILMGFYTVMSAMRAFQLIGLHDSARAMPYLDNGAKAIGWALLFDMLDGRIARLTKTNDATLLIRFPKVRDLTGESQIAQVVLNGGKESD